MWKDVRLWSFAGSLLLLLVLAITMSIYPIRALTWPTSCTKGGHISALWKKYYCWGTKHRVYGSGEWRFSWWGSTSIHEHLRTLFKKLICKYYKTFNKKIYTIDSENDEQNFVRLVQPFSFPKLFVSIRAKYFQLKALKVMEILSDEQIRDPRKI